MADTEQRCEDSAGTEESGNVEVAPNVDSPLNRLDEYCFWAVFMLATATVSKPLTIPAATIGVALLVLAYYKAGQASSPEAPDDIGFTRAFLIATLVIYGYTAISGSEIGIWFLLLCCMFLLHCARNLMIVEKVIIKPKPTNLALEPETPEPNPAPLEALSQRLGESSPATPRVESAIKRLFLLRQRGALYLNEDGPRDVTALREEMEKASAERGRTEDATQKDVLSLQLSSLARILSVAERPDSDFHDFRRIMDAVEEVLEDIGQNLDSGGGGESPSWEWLEPSLTVLETTLGGAEDALERTEESPDP